MKHVREIWAITFFQPQRLSRLLPSVRYNILRVSRLEEYSTLIYSLRERRGLQRCTSSGRGVRLRRNFVLSPLFYALLLADVSRQSAARGKSSQANTQKLIIWHLTKCAPRQYIGREIFLGGIVWWKSERITPSVIDRLARKSKAAALWNFAKQLSFSLSS